MDIHQYNVLVCEDTILLNELYVLTKKKENKNHSEKKRTLI